MNNENLQRVARQEAMVDLRGIGRLLRRRFLLILTSTVALVACAAAATFYMTPRYEATLSIRIDEPRAKLAPLDAAQGYALGREVATEMEVLRSRTLAEFVIDSLALQVRLGEPRRVNRSEVLSSARVLDRNASGTIRIQRDSPHSFTASHDDGSTSPAFHIGQPVELAGVAFTLAPEASAHQALTLEIGDYEETAEDFAAAMRVARPAREANIISLRYRDSDPVLASEALNTLATQFIQLRQQVQKADVHSTVAFLNGQIDALHRQLVAAEEELREFREHEGVVDLQVEAAAGVNRLVTLQAERSSIDAERAALAALIDEIERGDGSSPDEAASAFRQLLAFPTLLRNQAAAEMLRALSAGEEQRAELLQRRSPEDPDVQVLDARIAGLEEQLRALATTYLQGLTNQVDALDASLNQFGLELGRIPSREVQFARLQRDAEALEDLFTLLQTRLREAEIVQAADDQSVRIVDFAALPHEPVSPNTRLNLLAAGFIGLLLGVTIALGREHWDNSVRSRQDVMVATGVPVLGLIPRVRRLRGREEAGRADADRLHASAQDGRNRRARRIGSGQESERAALLEAYNALLTSIGFARGVPPAGTLMVTSPLPGEGKTFTAVNLALSYALDGRRTLLIDADLRRGGIHTIFGQDRGPGLSDLLAGNAPLNAACREVHLSDTKILHYLAAGSTVQNAANLLGSDRVEDLLAYLQDQFEVIVLDTPPVNLLADAAVLAPHTEGVVLVARSGTTDPQALAFAMEQLHASGADVIGAVLNDIDLERDAVYDQAYRWKLEGYAYSSR